MSKQAEFRAVARIDKETYDRLQRASDKTGISTSDLVRIGIKKSLPDWEAGRVIFEVKKAA